MTTYEDQSFRREKHLYVNEANELKDKAYELMRELYIYGNKDAWIQAPIIVQNAMIFILEQKRTRNLSQ